MDNIIKAICLACLLNICTSLGLAGYVFNSTSAQSEALARNFYNQTLIDNSVEREQLHDYIDKRIDLKLSQRQ